MVINELRVRNSASVPSVRGFGPQVHLNWKFHPMSATGISPQVQLKLWLIPNVTGIGLTVPNQMCFKEQLVYLHKSLSSTVVV
jgi:hypothetical protein